MGGAGRTPDLAGPCGRTWRMPGAEDRQATLCAYLIEASGYHVVIHHWIVAVVHLRALEAVDPPNRAYPEAEHELLILSLDPDAAVDPDADPIGSWPYLTPPEAAVQFHGVGDAGAKHVAELAVRAICSGASPDSDNRRFWQAAVPQTADHYRRGLHGLG